MSERLDTLQQYVSDMLALERHILEAIERQTDDAQMTDQPEANATVVETERMLKNHVSALESHLKALGGDGLSPVKSAVSSVMGFAAGLYDKVRPDGVAKMLRDDYTALSLDAISYTMLHTTGLVYDDAATADLALRHLSDISPLIVQISAIMPHAVAAELKDTPGAVTLGVAAQAVANTQGAWTREAVGKD